MLRELGGNHVEGSPTQSRNINGYCICGHRCKQQIKNLLQTKMALWRYNGRGRGRREGPGGNRIPDVRVLLLSAACLLRDAQLVGKSLRRLTRARNSSKWHKTAKKSRICADTIRTHLVCSPKPTALDKREMSTFLFFCSVFCSFCTASQKHHTPRRTGCFGMCLVVVVVVEVLEPCGSYDRVQGHHVRLVSAYYGGVRRRNKARAGGRRACFFLTQTYHHRPPPRAFCTIVVLRLKSRTVSIIVASANKIVAN